MLAKMDLREEKRREPLEEHIRREDSAPLLATRLFAGTHFRARARLHFAGIVIKSAKR